MYVMVLSVLTVVYFSLGLTAAVPPSELKHSGCIKVNGCKCLMRDGSGLIDLASVADEDGFIQRLKPLPSAVGTADVLLSFSPCLPFSQPEDFSNTDCTDVAACVIIRIHQDNRFISQYLNYGRHEGNKFSYNESKKTLTVSYSMFPDSEPQTVVHYQCSPNHSITHSQSFSADGPLQMWVESPCACPNACALVDVGPGTIFLIILCLSVTAYFIIGSCALRPFRTSNGVQMAPEDSVWCMICYQLSERPDGSRRKRNYSLTDTL
ncbi:uncharacterized protein LOC107699639 isoform X1 [Sinocyclocheilus anshuiensis]|uniref:uncharacterized protein LOC107699639 isoform X1 n=2 Tax=Sinocyclocheilus anshuiensis TaxID=1608454 RepID=UPI0007B8AE00|nr:PREDICTED: uncharacterized protein LOC107699639 isoform X1 [Sinocyclocheilus anshuiensis]